MNPEQHEMLVRIDERTANLVEGQADQEIRLRTLERFRNWAFGLFAALGSILGFRITPL